MLRNVAELVRSVESQHIEISEVMIRQEWNIAANPVVSG